MPVLWHIGRSQRDIESTRRCGGASARISVPSIGRCTVSSPALERRDKARELLFPWQM